MTPAELRKRREKLGLTQAQLAAYLDVAQSAISQWESGARAVLWPHALRVLLDLAEDDPELKARTQQREP